MKNKNYQNNNLQEKFEDLIDPKDIQGLSPEARKMLDKNANIQLLNQRNRKDFINDFKLEDINFMEIDLLLKFVNQMGKIVPRRTTGAQRKVQAKIAKAIKVARHLALIPYPNQAESAEFFD